MWNKCCYILLLKMLVLVMTFNTTMKIHQDFQATDILTVIDNVRNEMDAYAYKMLRLPKGPASLLLNFSWQSQMDLWAVPSSYTTFKILDFACSSIWNLVTKNLKMRHERPNTLWFYGFVGVLCKKCCFSFNFKVFLTTMSSEIRLTEDDIPKASLRGRNIAELKVDELKFWLKCCGDSSKGLKTKAKHVFGLLWTKTIFNLLVESKTS